LTDTTDLLADERTNAVPREVTASTPDGAGARAKPRRRSGGLSGMVLPELQALAADLGIGSTAKMRKSDLIAAIQTRQSGSPATDGSPAGQPAGQSSTLTLPANGQGPANGQVARPATVPVGGDATVPASGDATVPASGDATVPASGEATVPAEQPRTRQRRSGTRPAGAPVGQPSMPAIAEAPASEPAAAAVAPRGQAQSVDAQSADAQPVITQPAASSAVEAPAPAPSDADVDERPAREPRQREPREPRQRDSGQRDSGPRDSGQRDRSERHTGQDRQNGQDRPNGQVNQGGQANQDRQDRQPTQDRQPNQDRQSNQGGQERQSGRDRTPDRGQDRQDRGPDREEEDDGSGRRRRGRFRERNRNRPTRDRFGSEPDPVVADDDVLIPVAGIVDILDNYGFIRTSGYLAGPNDVYVSMAQVKKYGVRRGDAVTGAVRQPRDGDRKDKYNALVRLDTVNGMDPEEAKKRPEFHRLTPLYPQERLRLETEANLLTTRVIDLVMPLGKGQRALIVSPPKAGKTMVLQAIANAITTNNPECHLMVVLVDERPEEVTDMTRSVKGEVIASTFDRPPTDHTTVAELSIERAKRLVELGHDVVVLLDSITRLGRAYNLAAPASGRILSGGVDSTALYPPKRFLGAARNIENGGSLTIMATALVETGSTMDTVIFEEFKGTGNAELKLDRKIADKRVFPAIDVDPSGTRKEELLLSPEELSIVIKLRRVLHALDPQQALELLLERMRKTSTNAEFLMQIQKSTVGPDQ